MSRTEGLIQREEQYDLVNASLAIAHSVPPSLLGNDMPTPAQPPSSLSHDGAGIAGRVDGTAKVIQERLTLNSDLAGAVTVIACWIAFAMLGVPSVSHLDIGQILLQVWQFLVHRYAVVFPTIAHLDPPDHAGFIHPPSADHFAKVAVGKAITKTPVLQSQQQVAPRLGSDSGSQQISHVSSPVKNSLPNNSRGLGKPIEQEPHQVIVDEHLWAEWTHDCETAGRLVQGTGAVELLRSIL
jgi:hypothetical protein